MSRIPLNVQDEKWEELVPSQYGFMQQPEDVEDDELEEWLEVLEESLEEDELEELNS